MTVLRIPFHYTVYGRHGRRVPQGWRTVDVFEHEATELSEADAEGRVRFVTRHRSTEGLVFDGELFFPVEVDFLLDGVDARPATLDDMRDMLRRMALDEPTLAWAFEEEPFLLPGDLRQEDEPLALRAGAVLPMVPDDRERRLAEARRRASYFRLVDGRPFTSRYEPVLREDRDGRPYWSMADLAHQLDGRSAASRTGCLSGAAREAVDLSGVEESLDGDLHLVRWRCLDGHVAILRALDPLLRVLDPSAADRTFPVVRVEAAGLSVRLATLRDAVRSEEGIDLDLACDVLREAASFVGRNAVGDRIAAALDDVGRHLTALAGIRDRERQLPSDDLEAVASMSP